MKLIKRISFIMLFILSITMFAGCIKLVKSEKSVSVIEETIPTEITAKDFDITKIKLSVEFDNGTKAMISLTEKMIVNQKIEDIKTPGEHKIVVKYRDCMVDFKVNLLDKYPDTNVKFVFGDEVLETITIEKHTAINTLPNCAVAGYRFDGWYLESYFKTLVTEETVMDEVDQVVYGKFTPYSYTVKFVDTETVLEEKVIYGDAIYYLPELTDGKKEFVGWFLADGTKVTNKTIIKEDITVTAKWNN